MNTEQWIYCDHYALCHEGCAIYIDHRILYKIRPMEPKILQPFKLCRLSLAQSLDMNHTPTHAQAHFSISLSLSLQLLTPRGNHAS